MTALYEIVRYRDQFERLAESGEVDAQTVLDTLESLDGELNDKAVSIAQFSQNLDATAQAVREAAKAMLSRADRIEKRAESIRNYLLYNMQFAQVTKIECPWFVIAVRKNPAAVAIDDEAAIPEAYRVQPEPPPPRLDKKAIGAALKAGEDVPGARLVQSERLDIRV
jgi:hypothetical protein